MAGRPPPPDDYPPPSNEYPPPGPAREYEEAHGGRPPPPPPPWVREIPWIWVALFAILLAAGVIIAHRRLPQPPQLDEDGDRHLGVDSDDHGDDAADDHRHDLAESSSRCRACRGRRRSLRSTPSSPAGWCPTRIRPPRSNSAGRSWRKARPAEGAKLCVRTLTRKATTSSQVGNVVAQSPASGTSVQQYAQVTIYVGT
jgi:hypothetical protein